MASSKYQKLTAEQHILRRPEMYIGSVAGETMEAQIASWSRDSLRFSRGTLRASHGFFKVVDEILVNATDNALDPHHALTNPVTRLDVSADTATGRITVFNDGATLPVERHEEHAVWIPELVFGHLLSGRNFADDTDSVAAGLHGYGAKLTNLMASEFSVRCVQPGATYTQQWTANMSVTGAPDVTQGGEAGGPSGTTVSFIPDYARLGMPPGRLSPKVVAALLKRVADLAACFPKIAVTFNGRPLPATFPQYLECYGGMGTGPFRYVHVSAGRHLERFDVGLVHFDEPAGSLRKDAVAMVNGVVTPLGGPHLTHARHIVNRVGSAAAEDFVSDTKRFNAARFGGSCLVVTSCFAARPRFDSQSKTRLVSAHEFATPGSGSVGFKAAVAEVAAIPGFCDTYFDSVYANKARPPKSARALQLAIPKAHDAPRVGKEPTTLVITEGDSGFALALGSLTAEQRRTTGVFPLRGKVLNVRNDKRRLKDNKELMNLFALIGLQPGAAAPDRQELRYQHVVVMADQDPDGSHIRGLVANAFAVLFPALLCQPGFLSFFATPLVKAFPRGQQERWFYSTAEFERWRTGEGSGVPQHRPARYYKGLGTSTTAEGKQYFQLIEDHVRPLTFDRTPRGMDADFAKVFDKLQADVRRKWLQQGRLEENPEPASIATPDALKPLLALPAGQVPRRVVPHDLFLQQDMLSFALYDNSRSVPSVIDGLKTAQRKILWVALTSPKLRDAVRVTQLGGIVSQAMAYHHGEESLQRSVVLLAQDYVGSNNIPLLAAEGQFGTRLGAGKDNAAARYLYTKQHRMAPLVFPPADLPLLRRLVEDGEELEPRHFVPVVPLLLVNGGMGITVGHSFNVPPHNPVDVIAAVRQRIRGATRPGARLRLAPWYAGFLGSVTREAGTVTVRGRVVPGARGALRIIDLPPSRSVEAVRARLLALRQERKVVDFTDYCTTSAVDFEVRLPEGADAAAVLESIGLTAKVSCRQCYFTEDRQIVSSDSSDVGPILDRFMPERRALYVDRLRSMREKQQVRYDVARGRLMLAADLEAGTLTGATLAREAELHAHLQRRQYPVVGGGYGYVTDLSISALHKVRGDEAKVAAHKAELDRLHRVTPDELWLEDLDALEAACVEYSQARLDGVLAELNARLPLPAEPRGKKVKGASKKAKGADRGPMGAAQAGGTPSHDVASRTAAPSAAAMALCAVATPPAFSPWAFAPWVGVPPLRAGRPVWGPMMSRLASTAHRFVPRLLL